MFSWLSALAISFAYATIGSYHLLRLGRMPRSSRPVLTAHGAIWMVLGITYLWAGLSQYFSSAGEDLLSREFFHLNYTCAFAVLIPYCYFAVYLLFGKRHLGRLALAAAVVVAALGVGLVFTTPVLPRTFSWGGTWDFTSRRVSLFYLSVGIAPVAASLAAFLLYLYPRTASAEARRRLLLTTIAFTLLVASWAILITRTSPALLISRILALLSGTAAHLAYFPPDFLRRADGV
jgi:hypothetical protein